MLRQIYLSEEVLIQNLNYLNKSIEISKLGYSIVNPRNKEKKNVAAKLEASMQYQRWVLRYTLGEDIDVLRNDFGIVLDTYLKYADQLWESWKKPEDIIFNFYILSEYLALIQNVSLCFLLHRKDLLSFFPYFQDGKNGKMGGKDWLFEEMLCATFAPKDRFNSKELCHEEIFGELADVYTETEDGRASDFEIKKLGQFLEKKNRLFENVKDKSIAENIDSGQVGFWSFDAAAAVLLNKIADDSTLHRFEHYPKDLIKWSLDNLHLSDEKWIEPYVRVKKAIESKNFNIEADEHLSQSAFGKVIRSVSKSISGVAQENLKSLKLTRKKKSINVELKVKIYDDCAGNYHLSYLVEVPLDENEIKVLKKGSNADFSKMDLMYFKTLLNWAIELFSKEDLILKKPIKKSRAAEKAVSGLFKLIAPNEKSLFKEFKNQKSEEEIELNEYCFLEVLYFLREHDYVVHVDWKDSGSFLRLTSDLLIKMGQKDPANDIIKLNEDEDMDDLSVKSEVLLMASKLSLVSVPTNDDNYLFIVIYADFKEELKNIASLFKVDI